jgi:uncharacterized protein (TIGR03643 family)
MTEEKRSLIIRMAWEDRTTFDEIFSKTGLSEAEVIKLMRESLKPGSFRRWRKRVSGRMTKHAVKLRDKRAELRRVSSLTLLNFDDGE